MYNLIKLQQIYGNTTDIKQLQITLVIMMIFMLMLIIVLGLNLKEKYWEK